MYMTAELIRDRHQQDIEQAARVRLALQMRALRKAARRARRAEDRMLRARKVAARLRTELEA
jgi:hypothetical protein